MGGEIQLIIFALTNAVVIGGYPESGVQSTQLCIDNMHYSFRAKDLRHQIDLKINIKDTLDYKIRHIHRSSSDYIIHFHYIKIKPCTLIIHTGYTTKIKDSR